MPRLFIYLFILCPLIIIPCYSENVEIPPLLVITELRTIGEQSSKAEARAFSDFISNEIERTGLYRILSRSSFNAIMKAQSFTSRCFDLPCFTSMGRIVGADEMLAGHIKRRGSSLEITLRRIDIKEERFLKTLTRSSTELSSSQIMGPWGRRLISASFNIELKKLLPPEGEEIDIDQQKQQKGIPLSVKQKYPGMIYIPEGMVVVGTKSGDPCEKPPHKIHLEPFYIGKYEVTNQEYREFVIESGHAAPQHWEANQIPPGLEKHPVTWVSFEDAEAYCLWKSGRLPSEAEWERAAHSKQPSLYPWGDEFDPNRANIWQEGRRGTAPVGSYPLGASRFGAEDMAGNVFEWVNGFFRPYPGSRTRFKESDKHKRILRGGSWNFNQYYARTTHRFPRMGGEKSRSYGFRLARNP